MHKLLALDTSTEACSVALYLDGDLTESVALEPRAHARLCLPMVEEILRQEDIELADLDAIAFGRGPGSFTGLRIAASITQGLALSLGIPVIPVSTLEAMAMQFGLDYLASPNRVFGSEQKNLGESLQVLTLLDARMQEVYTATFTLKPTMPRSMPKLQMHERVVPPALVEIPDSGFVALGSGLRYGAEMADGLQSALCQLEGSFPKAGAIALLASMYGNDQCMSAAEAQPIYLRDEVTWQKLPGR